MNVTRYTAEVVARVKVTRRDDGLLLVEVTLRDRVRWEHAYLGGSLPPRISEPLADELAGAAVLVNPGEVAFPLIELDVRDADADGLDWEGWARTNLSHSAPPVRRCHVRPQVRDIPLSYPIRLLEIHAQGVSSTKERLAPVVARIFSNDDFSDAMQAAECTWDEILEFRERSAWPTADVLFFDHAPDVDAEALFDLTASWQTRLVVIETHQPSAHARLAAALANLGGPAVLAAMPGQRFELMLDLVHDYPLDFVAHELRGARLLVVGAGRESLLRVSAIVERLTDPALERAIEDMIGHAPSARSAPDAANEDNQRGGARPRSHGGGGRTRVRGGYSRSSGSGDEADDGGYAAEADDSDDVYFDDEDDSAVSFGFAPEPEPEPTLLAGFLQHAAVELEQLGFDHERRGTLPSAKLVRRLKTIVQSQIPKADRNPPSGEAKSPLARRYVNAVLHDACSAQRTRLHSEHGWVEPGQAIDLAIQIGERIAELRTVGISAFVEEAVLYDHNRDDVLIEVGVTSLDFELLGSPVQRIRLPRTGESDIATFRLSPRESTWIRYVARLRFCLYHRNALIQSFRLVVAHRPKKARRAATPRRAFLRALDMHESDSHGLPGMTGGYVTRREYSAFDLADVRDAASSRRFSFFVNRSADQVVVTLKGEKVFVGRPSKTLPDKVEAVREAMKNSSYALDKGAINQSEYRFMDQGERNRGSADGYAAALCDLAATGWDMYSDLVPEAQRPAFATVLADPVDIVHAGQLSLEAVIPWGVAYLRYFDALSGAAQAACSAPIEDPSKHRCGEHPNCPLHKANPAHAELTEATTACPRYFLGFRQRIELPPQQVDGDAGDPSVPPPASMRRFVISDQRPRIIAGYNRGLDLAAGHVESGGLRVALTSADFMPLPIDTRNRLLEALRTTESEIVYVYCHALTSFKAPHRTLGPHLVIEDSETLAGRMIPADVTDFKFVRHPLVFLNGCHTVGFSPFAPAEFIKRLVDSGASAIVGTEATVWEALAVEMAETFLDNFVDSGMTAGEALLQARLALLRKQNPLGLAYTLYGSAELILLRAAPPGNG